ncbi:MAG: NAD(P)H-hydrate dehydratase [Thermodesulfobacteriota bacterium]|nr:NAD(P)H-hydrate dehydratase [Thermodesulfobacteriota bacterium]
MLLLAGTIPVKDLPLLMGRIKFTEQGVKVDNQVLDINRGTAAMLFAAYMICREYGLEGPIGIVAGDIGASDGSLKIYDYLAKNLQQMDVSVLTFHYIMPNIKSNKKVLEKIDSLKKRPVLIADAGGMYVAKAGGDSNRYDVFTPDLGELAFLADEKAVHPTYTRGFIYHMDDDVPELISRAFKSKNIARTLFVKGKVDYICQDGEILEEIDHPNIEALEAVGGTGDMITGIISGLIYAGKSPIEACRIAGRVNRRAGELSRPTPATQVKDIITHIPAALREVLKQQG